MRLVSINRAAGFELARDLPSGGASKAPMLRAGVVISERLSQQLITRGVHAVWVHDGLSEGVEPVELMPERVRKESASRVVTALATARGAFESRAILPMGVVDELSDVVQLIARSLIDSPDASLALSDLATADAYTHFHSINVTALGLLLGREAFRSYGWIDYKRQRRFDRIDQQLTLLGMGLLLHDIGKLAVPAEIVNKPAALTPDEWDIMRTHPEAGVALLNPRLISPLVLTVIRSHHERWDGSGYPRGATGDAIHQFARIAAIADVYDAVTSERPYKAASPPSTGVRVITDGDGERFDSELVKVFRRTVFPHPVGTEVTLPDGPTGVVVSVEPSRPDHPVVRFQDGSATVEVVVDLSQGVPVAQG